jgi:hypothetical protein
MPSKMKTCEGHRTALTDAAAAAVQPSLELRLHLDACASCRAAFAEEMQLFAAIDTGLHATANAKVPGSLFPRVRVQLNERPVPGRTWAPAFAAIGVVATLVVAIVFVQGHRRAGAESNLQTNTATRDPAPTEIPDALAPAVVPSRTQAAKREPDRRRPVTSGNQVERVFVLIPAGQKRAVDALLAGLRNGGVKADVLVAEHSEQPSQDFQLSPLTISPIEIKPLAIVSEESALEKEKTIR